MVVRVCLRRTSVSAPGATSEVIVECLAVRLFVEPPKAPRT